MSAIRNPATITSVGRRMMTAGGDITYTKAVLYGQDISHLTREQLESLTSIGNPLVTVPLGISDKNDNDNGTTVILEATFQNSNLKADLPYTAVGFFAKRGDDAEKLIAVGVATEGAYLAATSPDGVATDALDIKVAIAIGDSANVTAMIDPAGSVTPAALHNVITDVKSEMKTGLDTKADKSTVDSDVKSINDTLAAKADKQTVTDDLVKKADKTDVDAQIGTVNKSVSDLSDTVKANKDDADKTLATKADKATVESDLATKANQSDLDKTNAEVAKKANSDDVKAQIDGVSKSISDVSDTVKANQDATDQALATKADKTDVAKDIDTVNKSISSMSATITANQKATDTALDTKADKTTVNQELATKANSTDVDDKLAAKADSADVTKQIKTITDLANTKADQTALDATNATMATKANSTDVYTKTDTDKLLDAKADKAAVEQSLSTKANSADVDKKLDKKADKSSIDAKINAIDFSKIKFRKQRVNSDGQAADTTWSATKNSDGSYTIDIYQDDWTAYKVASLLQAITTKADQSSLDATNKTVATKANSSDVYTKKQVDDAFSSRDATIATKADKAMVDTEISKIDFTPYAKTADVDSKLQGYTNTADLTKLLDVKANAVDVYSKTELDKKLLDLSTDTDGKVNADQVSSMIANKVDKSDLASDLKSINDSIATKADKTTVESDLATKADQSSLDETNAEVAKKADKADVTKQIKTVTDLANSKADATYSYSKAELDKKFLQLSTDTGGKVDASQVATMIENKADKSDVTKQIGTVTDLVNTKANSTDVDAALDKKDDITDVDAKIKKVTDLANKAQSTADSKVKSNWAIDNSNGKFVAANVPADGTATQSFTQTGLDLLNTLATKSQVADAKNTANQAIDDYNKRPVIRGNDGDDLLAYKTNQLRLYVDVKNCKNLPPASNTQWFTVEYIFENPNGDGVAIFRSPASEVWLNGNNGGNYNNWLRLANAGDINNLQNAINTKANAGDVSALQNKVNVNTPLFREISADSTWEDIFGVTNPNNVLTSLRINPGGSGQLVNDFAAGIGFGGNDTKAVISVDYGSHVARFTAGNGTSPGWSEDVAWKSDIDRLQSIINQQNQTIQSLTSRLNNAENEINYIKANYVEGRTFPASQEAQANSWENENPQRIAFIEK